MASVLLLEQEYSETAQIAQEVRSTQADLSEEDMEFAEHVYDQCISEGYTKSFSHFIRHDFKI